jgi:hypothetical protein
MPCWLACRGRPHTAPLAGPQPPPPAPLPHTPHPPTRAGAAGAPGRGGRDRQDALPRAARGGLRLRRLAGGAAPSTAQPSAAAPAACIARRALAARVHAAPALLRPTAPAPPPPLAPRSLTLTPSHPLTHPHPLTPHPRAQARFLLAKLNPSSTYNTAAPMSSEVIMTDDVSLAVFTEHLKRLAVQS